MYEYNATIVNVVDGDTVDALVDLGFHITHKIRLRLAYIDTKELNSKVESDRILANAAKKRVEELVLNKKVLIETYKTDKYGRYIADVYFNEQIVGLGLQFTSLNELLLNEGLAERYID